MPEETQMTLDDAAQPEATALIAVTQLPVIEERLREVKELVEAAVTEAKSMVATADTVQAVKNRRAELNKQFDALEKQRKAVKDQIMAPYNSFEAVYKECISGPFKAADASLKATVDGFENDLKEKTQEKLKAYYEELCAAEKLDWLPFARAMSIGNIRISMADTKANQPRKLMDAIANVVATVMTATDQISQMEDSAAIMAEYKICLDVGSAVAAVQNRKRQIEAEQEAAARRKEDAEKRAEAIAKVEAAMAKATPAEAPVAAPAATTAAKPLNKSMSFKIFFKTTAEYEIVKPILAELKATLVREGIQYE